MGSDLVSMRERALTALLVAETLLIFVAAPLAAMGYHLPLFGGLPLVFLLVAAIVIASPGRGARALVLIALGIGMAGAALRISHPSLVTVWSGHIATILGLLAVSLVIARAVLAQGRVTFYRIQGAIVLYLNIAVAFTSAYRLLMELDPGAFNVAQHGGEASTISLMLYFSFTTLTSTGFGEIVPVHPLARSLTNLEAVLGQLYLIILLGRLVTLHTGSRRDDAFGGC